MVGITFMVFITFMGDTASAWNTMEWKDEYGDKKCAIYIYPNFRSKQY